MTRASEIARKSQKLEKSEIISPPPLFSNSFDYKKNDISGANMMI